MDVRRFEQIIRLGGRRIGPKIKIQNKCRKIPSIRLNYCFS